MEKRSSTRHSVSRPPLSDATKKATNYATTNNINTHRSSGEVKPLTRLDGLRGKAQNENVRPTTRRQDYEPGPVSSTSSRYSADFSTKSKANAPPAEQQQQRRRSATLQAKDSQPDAKRASQFSDISSTASSTRQFKTHIGPWQLGKVLRKGSSARVRIARHRASHQLAAVKIVAKTTAHLNQAGSLAKIDKIDTTAPAPEDGGRRMPLALEREVAILKLIEHPNVIKLYDIWENRSEIYLVTEFVDKGDLFAFINSLDTCLDEEHVMFFFRQIMNAIEYCHSLNICHRDLKPENILLDSNHTIKIADFGMAALHQAPNHQLKTACGSPHYAAPELLRHQSYKGAAADIWSMGVILFAMHAGRLPFDDPDLHVMLSRAKKAQYDMPQFFEDDMQDLIRKILVPSPNNRITMKQMWEHDVVEAYSYLDQYMKEPCRVRNRRSEVQAVAVPDAEIDTQILRQLKSLWHASSDSDLKAKLSSSRPNDQKIFYRLLYNHRESQLENYNNDLLISKTDYHHLKPPNWRKRISTCQFTQPARNGHARNVSRFTVISNVAETDESATVRSYDPYNASRVVHPWASQASHSKIVVHRNGSANGSRDGTVTSHSYRSYHSIGNSFQRNRLNSQRSPATGPNRSRGSMSSIQSNRGGTPRVRASSRYRRGVDFSSIRRRSVLDSAGRSNLAPASIAGDTTTYERDVSHPRGGLCSPRKMTSPQKLAKQRRDGAAVRNPKQAAKLRDQTHWWNEELKQLGNGIAQTCDEAFRSSLLLPDTSEDNPEGNSCADLLTSLPSTLDATGTPLSASTNLAGQVASRRWDSRPLPPVPPEDASTPKQTKNVAAAKNNPNWVTASTTTASATDRRTVSAPVHSQYNKSAGVLPSIYEPCKSRTVSAPADSSAAFSPNDRHGPELLSTDKTIRVVDSPSVNKRNIPLADAPAPLNIRKKPSRVFPDVPNSNSTRQAVVKSDSTDWQTTTMGDTPIRGHDSVDVATSAATARLAAAVVKKSKRTSWFKRMSRDEAQNSASANTSFVTTAADENSFQSTEPRPSMNVTAAGSSDPHRMSSQSTTGAGVPQPPPKKKSFALSFWKGGKSEYRMSLAGPEYVETPSPEQEKNKPGRPTKPSRNASAMTINSGANASGIWEENYDSGSRQIEVHQNWLARLFRVKPAMRYLCFTISKRRARQEIAILLREWRKYGIKDVEVDKERNIVFAQVTKKNYLNIKEVAFAAEIMTVIEHGKRNHLAIVRFTQERGAASSFHEVVERMKTVFGNRGLVVSDKRKRKMMIKTLNS